MSELEPNYFDTDGRPEPEGNPDAERKLKVWAVLNAVDQGLMNADEACTAYGISAEEMDEHRAGWMDFEAGSR